MDSAFKIRIQIHSNCKSTRSVAARHTRNWAIVFSKALKKGNGLLLSVVPSCALKRLKWTAALSWAALHSLTTVVFVRASVYSLLTSVVNRNICVLCIGRIYTFFRKKWHPFLWWQKHSQLGDAIQGNSKWEMQYCGSNFFHTKVTVPQLWTQCINKIQRGLLIQMYRKHEVNFIGFKCCDWQTVLEEDHCKMCKLRYRSSPIRLFAEWCVFRVRNVITQLKITWNNWLKCYKW